MDLELKDNIRPDPVRVDFHSIGDFPCAMWATDFIHGPRVRFKYINLSSENDNGKAYNVLLYSRLLKQVAKALYVFSETGLVLNAGVAEIGQSRKWESLKSALWLPFSTGSAAYRNLYMFEFSEYLLTQWRQWRG